MFEDWLYETENNSLRIERLLEDVQTDNAGKLIMWLEAAYNVGCQSCGTELMDVNK